MAKATKHAAARGNQVTPGQLEELMSQIKRGAITHETMQEFLVTHGDPLAKYPRVSLPYRSIALRKWEDRAPGAGEYALELFERFEALAFKLQPPCVDIELRCRSAVFWRPYGIRSIRFVKASDLLATTYEIDGDFARQLKSAVWGTISYADLIDFSGRHWNAFPDRLEEEFEREVFDELDETMRHIADVIDEAANIKELEDGLPFEVCAAVAFQLKSVIGAAIAFHIKGMRDYSRRLKLLATLWLEGNPLIGFDQDNNLLVLVA